MRAWSHAAALSIGVALVANSCGLTESATKGEIIIASDFPTSGSIRVGGRPGEAGVAYAVQLASPLKGFKLVHVAYDVLKITRVAVWSDSVQFGKHVADAFATRFEARGGVIVARQDFPFIVQKKDFTPFFKRAKDAGAEGIYAGAVTGTGGCTAKAQAKGIIDVYYLGSDGIGDSQCIKDAADQANDKMYFTVAAPVAAQDPANKSLIDAFMKAFP